MMPCLEMTPGSTLPVGDQSAFGYIPEPMKVELPASMFRDSIAIQPLKDERTPTCGSFPLSPAPMSPPSLPAALQEVSTLPPPPAAAAVPVISLSLASALAAPGVQDGPAGFPMDCGIAGLGWLQSSPDSCSGGTQICSSPGPTRASLSLPISLSAALPAPATPSPPALFPEDAFGMGRRFSDASASSLASLPSDALANERPKVELSKLLQVTADEPKEECGDFFGQSWGPFEAAPPKLQAGQFLLSGVEAPPGLGQDHTPKSLWFDAGWAAGKQAAWCSDSAPYFSEDWTPTAAPSSDKDSTQSFSEASSDHELAAASEQEMPGSGAPSKLASPVFLDLPPGLDLPTGLGPWTCLTEDVRQQSTARSQGGRAKQEPRGEQLAGRTCSKGSAKSGQADAKSGHRVPAHGGARDCCVPGACLEVPGEGTAVAKAARRPRKARAHAGSEQQ